MDLNASQDWRCTSGSVSRPSGKAREQAKPPDSLSCRQAIPMSVDALHAALGVLFTFVWLLVGQIIVGSR